jgi:hypothetical protein
MRMRPDLIDSATAEPDGNAFASTEGGSLDRKVPVSQSS